MSEDIEAWLEALGLAEYAEAFRANDVDLDVLPELDIGELRELGVSLGHAKRILRALGARDDTRGLREADAWDDRPRRVPAGEADAEHRQLTVAFCDLVGSTGLSEALDPEDLRAVFDVYYRRCGEIARAFGGHLAKVTGDGVDLHFGYPHALEKSAAAAVEAALEVVQAVATMNAERDPGVPELAVRVGVHTGLAVVGAVGGAEHEVVGDMPVVAARIQSVAHPGSVVLSEATAQLVGRDLLLDDLGTHELKGLSTPVRLFAVAGGESYPTGNVAPQPSVDTGLVGREAEMASLHARWELAREGQGQAVVLTGEAGIGKSKVALTLASDASGRPQVVRFQCSPYRTGTALWPVIEQLRRAAEIQPDQPASVRLERLERSLGADRDTDVVPVFASLLSIPYEERYPRLTLTPEQLRERTLTAVADRVGDLCRDRPALLVFEDVHWADPTSLELIGTVLERAAAWRVLIVMTCRPDFAVPWPELPHLATLQLGRLAERHVRAIVDRLVEGKSLPEAVVDRILVRTDGVPLFVEELTRTVLESEMLVDEGPSYSLAEPLLDVAIPATLHDSLSTRLDRLGPVREVAQVASVIGREFSFDLLADTTGMSRAELEPALETLQRSGLVLRRELHSADWFTFKHALVQSAAYESMLRSRRRDLHARIASALELRPDVPGEQPELLARHLDLAGLVERAIDAYLRAGERATAGSHHEEALAHYRRALELLSTLPASRERSERELDIHTALRNALVVLRGYSSPEVEEACALALALCEELGVNEQQFPVLWNLAGFHMVRGDHTSCEGINARLLEIADTSADPELALLAHDTVGQTLVYQGRFEEALVHLSLARGLYDAAAHRDLAARFAEEDPGAAALGYGAFTLWLLGRRAEGRAWLDEAVALAESLPFLVTQLLVMSLVVHLAYFRRDVESARSSAFSLRSLSEENGLAYYVPAAQVQEGWVRVIDGDASAGIELMQAGIAGFDRIGALVEQPFNGLLLADGLVRAEQPAAAVAVLDETLAMIRRRGERCLEPELLRVRAVARAAQGAPAVDVERDLRDAIVLATQRGAHSLRLHAATSLARFQLERELAADPGTLAGALASVCDDLDQPDVQEARTLLAQLHQDELPR